MQPTPGMKFAPIEKDETDLLEAQIDQLLRAIDHEEALITDRATLSDFSSGSDTIGQKHVNAIRRQLGITVQESDTFVAMAKQLKAKGR